MAVRAASLCRLLGTSNMLPFQDQAAVMTDTDQATSTKDGPVRTTAANVTRRQQGNQPANNNIKSNIDVLEALDGSSSDTRDKSGHDAAVTTPPRKRLLGDGDGGNNDPSSNGMDIDALSPNIIYSTPPPFLEAAQDADGQAHPSEGDRKAATSANIAIGHAPLPSKHEDVNVRTTFKECAAGATGSNKNGTIPCNGPSIKRKIVKNNENIMVPLINGEEARPFRLATPKSSRQNPLQQQLEPAEGEYEQKEQLEDEWMNDVKAISEKVAVDMDVKTEAKEPTDDKVITAAPSEGWDEEAEDNRDEVYGTGTASAPEDNIYQERSGTVVDDGSSVGYSTTDPVMNEMHEAARSLLMLQRQQPVCSAESGNSFWCGVRLRGGCPGSASSGIFCVEDKMAWSNA